MSLPKTAPRSTEPIQKFADILIGQTVVRATDKNERIGNRRALLKELRRVASADPVIISVGEDHRLGLVPDAMDVPNYIFALAGKELGDSLRVAPSPGHCAEAFPKKPVIVCRRDPALQTLDCIEQIQILRLQRAHAVLEPGSIGRAPEPSHLPLSYIRDGKPNVRVSRGQILLAARAPILARLLGRRVNRVFNQALPA